MTRLHILKISNIGKLMHHKTNITAVTACSSNELNSRYYKPKSKNGKHVRIRHDTTKHLHE